MAITPFPGNIVVFGQAAPGAAVTGAQTYSDYNTTVAPSVFNMGTILLDPRSFYTYAPGNAYNYVTMGWFGNSPSQVIDQVPTVVSSNSVAQAQSFVAGTALTLTASNTNNVTTGVSITAPESGATVTGLRAIDGAQTPVTFGSDGSIGVWDPTEAISRNVTITTTGVDTGGFWTVTGRDLYGFKMSETIAASSVAATAAGKKAFKYITGITPTTTGTFGSTIAMVGVGDVFGLPLYVSNGAYAQINWGGVSYSSTNVTAGQSLSSVATSTTPDVRGTFASSVASDGTRRLVMMVFPSVAATAASITGGNAGQGVVGISQYSSV